MVCVPQYNAVYKCPYCLILCLSNHSYATTPIVGLTPLRTNKLLARCEVVSPASSNCVQAQEQQQAWTFPPQPHFQSNLFPSSPYEPRSSLSHLLLPSLTIPHLSSLIHQRPPPHPPPQIRLPQPPRKRPPHLAQLPAPPFLSLFPADPDAGC